MLVARSRIEGGHHRLFARRRRRSSQPWRSWQRCAMASLTNSWEAACALVHGPLHCQGQEEEKEASKKEEDGGCRTEQDLKRPCCTLLTTPRLVRTSSVVSEAPSRRRQTAVSRFVLEALKSPHTLTLHTARKVRSHCSRPGSSRSAPSETSSTTSAAGRESCIGKVSCNAVIIRPMSGCTRMEASALHPSRSPARGHLRRRRAVFA